MRNVLVKASLVSMLLGTVAAYGSEKEEKVELIDVEANKSVYLSKKEYKHETMEVMQEDGRVRIVPKRNMSLDAVKLAWKTRKERAKLKKEIRKSLQQEKYEFNEFHRQNQKRLGKKNWALLNDITSAAAKMIEKQYDGFDSVDAGIDCLQKVTEQSELLGLEQMSYAEQNNLEKNLEELRVSCVSKLKKFKKMKKAGTSKRVKNEPEYMSKDRMPVHRADYLTVVEKVSSKEGVSKELKELVLKAVSERDMKCTVTGWGVTGGFFISGRMDFNRFKCSTTLGNRSFYGLSNVGAGGGFGLQVIKWKQIYAKYRNAEGKVNYERLKYGVPYDSRGLKWGGFAGLSATFGMGMDYTLEITSATDQDVYNHTDGYSLPDYPGFGFNTYGLGLGVNVGLANFFKMKEIRPDFRGLYQTLGLKLS